jgi:hypothetical protein
VSRLIGEKQIMPVVIEIDLEMVEGRVLGPLVPMMPGHAKGHTFRVDQDSIRIRTFILVHVQLRVCSLTILEQMNCGEK